MTFIVYSFFPSEQKSFSSLYFFKRKHISKILSYSDVFFFRRFRAGLIYTYIGEVCVSVNPYRTLNIYGQDYINKYKGNIMVFKFFTSTRTWDRILFIFWLIKSKECFKGTKKEVKRHLWRENKHMEIHARHILFEPEKDS